MNKKEALAQAKHLWGPEGEVMVVLCLPHGRGVPGCTSADHGACSGGQRECRVGAMPRPWFVIYGSGGTWEAAFEDAARRKT